MSEYNLDFSEAMSNASKLILSSDIMVDESQRAALYTALVSIEVSLKYLLDQAGVSVPRTHDLKKLIDLVSKCSVEDEISIGVIRRVPATRIRSIIVDANYANATLGNLLEAECVGASVFPNEIRYGTVLKHYPAVVIQKASEALLSWVRRFESTIMA